MKKTRGTIRNRDRCIAAASACILAIGGGIAAYGALCVPTTAERLDRTAAAAYLAQHPVEPGARGQTRAPAIAVRATGSDNVARLGQALRQGRRACRHDHHHAMPQATIVGTVGSPDGLATNVWAGTVR